MYTKSNHRHRGGGDGAQISPSSLAAEAWTAFTPTLTQSGAVTVTVTRARYMLMGKTAVVQIALIVTGSGTAGNDITIGSIPAAIAPLSPGANTCIVGVGMIQDAGTINYGGLTAIAPTASTVYFQPYNTSTRIGANPSFALAVNDIISCQLVYEIA